MLEIVVPETDFFDEATSDFIKVNETKLTLEHSLVSLSKWESKWKKPFLSSEKSLEEIRDYVRCMTLTQNVKPEVYIALNKDNINDVINYIDDPMTATWFNEDESKSPTRKKEIITAEIIYYWMISLQIPVEFQKWHLNRLMTLIKVCSIKNAPDKKMDKKALLSRNANLNAARRAAMRSRG